MAVATKKSVKYFVWVFFFTDVPVYHTILCCSCCSCCCSFSSVVSKVHFLLALNTFCFCPNLPSPSPPFQIYCQSLDFFLCVHAKKKGSTSPTQRNELDRVEKEERCVVFKWASFFFTFFFVNADVYSMKLRESAHFLIFARVKKKKKVHRVRFTALNLSRWNAQRPPLKNEPHVNTIERQQSIANVPTNEKCIGHNFLYKCVVYIDTDN